MLLCFVVLLLVLLLCSLSVCVTECACTLANAYASHEVIRDSEVECVTQKLC